MSEKLIVLGTGNATVTRCYNTCFALFDGEEYILTDAGGGNGILRILEEAGIPYSRIKNAFLTHRHTDHILGMIWVLRMIGTLMTAEKYEGDFQVYGHAEVIHDLETISAVTLDHRVTRHLGTRIRLIPVEDGETARLGSYDFTFFDIGSTKTKQFGFSLRLRSGATLTCLGDEPYNPVCRSHVENADWLLCEAFCLYSDRDRFHPYEKHHSTVKDACELADQLHIKNLILWHTEDKNLSHRKELYGREGREYYRGRLFIPDDLEVIDLD